MDQENIPVGQNFQNVIAKAITNSDVLLVLMGPKWLELMKPANAESDLVVEEIAMALAHELAVVPVLLGNTPMPAASDLPPRIQHLATRHALKLDPGERFGSDFERLIKALSFSPGRKTGRFQRILDWFKS